MPPFSSPLAFEKGQFDGWTTWFAHDFQHGTVGFNVRTRSAMALKAFQAAFWSGRAIHVIDKSWPEKSAALKRIYRPEDAPEALKYEPIVTKLPETEALDTALVWVQATLRLIPEWRFYVLHFGAGDPDPMQFWHRWNQALEIPALPEWAGQLWRIGLKEQLVQPIYSRGCKCWRISAASDKWIPIVSHVAVDRKIVALAA